MSKFAKLLLYFVLPASIGLSSASIYLYQRGRAKDFLTPLLPKGTAFVPTETPPTPTPYVISDDLPPLYPNVNWRGPLENKYGFTDNDNKTDFTEGVRFEFETQNEKVSNDALDYFYSQLTKTGWLMTMDAGGPPGIFTGYQKGDRFVNVGTEFTPEGPGPNQKIIKYTLYIEYN